jgi:hypothetical protein
VCADDVNLLGENTNIRKRNESADRGIDRHQTAGQNHKVGLKIDSKYFENNSTFKYFGNGARKS